MEKDNNKGLVVLFILLVVAIFAGIFFAVFTYHKKISTRKMIYINGKKYYLEGFEEKIEKYVTTDENSCFGVSALVLTENNSIYFGASNDKKIPLVKITTNSKISDITKQAIEPHKSGTGSCNELGLFVKLKNKQIKPIKIKYNEKNDEVKAFLTDYDVSNIAYQLEDILIFKDHTLSTVSLFLDDTSKRIMYEGKEFKVDAIVGSFYIENDTLVNELTKKQTEPHMMCYLAISNNKSYILCGNAYSYEPPRTIDSVKLYKEGYETYIIKKTEDEVTVSTKNSSTETLKTSKTGVYEFK